MDLKDLLKIEKLSKKDRVMLAMFIMGAIVLVVILFSNYKNSRTRTTVKTINKVQKSGVSAAAITKKDTEERRKKKKIDLSNIEELIRGVGREDPFLPSERKTYIRSKYSLEFRLEGITIDSDGRPMAIINDKIVGVGDMIADGEVVKIGKEKVTVKVGKKKYNLRL